MPSGHPRSAHPLPASVNEALSTLKHGSFQERWDVAKHLPSLGSAILDSLIQLLAEEDPELSWFIARILGQFQHPTALLALVDLLSAEEEDLSRAAADALGNLGESAIALLSAQLAQPDHRLATVRALALTQHPDILEPLLSVVEDSDPQVRAMTIATLSNWMDARVTPVVIKALDDTSAIVRYEAVIGVGLLASRLHQADGPTLGPTLEALTELLSPCLGDLNLKVCTQAVLSLGRVGSDRAAASIAQVMLADFTPPDLQHTCIITLGWIPTPVAVQALTQALDHFLPQAPILAQTVITTLGQLEHPDGIRVASQRLADLALDPAPLTVALRQTLAMSLGQLGSQHAYPAIIQGLTRLANDDHDGVRLHAIAALDRSQS